MPATPQVILALFHDYRPPDDGVWADEFHEPVLDVYRAPALRVHFQVPQIPHLSECAAVREMQACALT